MLIAAAVDHQAQLHRSFMVGDRWRDVGAGKAADCTTILVNRYPEPAAPPFSPDVELADLPEAADWILTVALEREAQR
jgi:D-glycero-D-manno-heptose 1,7-bisphosphate phosphatase